MTTRKSRTARTAASSLDETLVEYFFTGKVPSYFCPARQLYLEDRFFNRAGNVTMKAWERHRSAVMAEWKRQKRPGLPWGTIFDTMPSPKAKKCESGPLNK